MLFASLACMWTILGLVVFDGWARILMLICAVLTATAAAGMYSKQQSEKQTKH